MLTTNLLSGGIHHEEENSVFGTGAGNAFTFVRLRLQHHAGKGRSSLCSLGRCRIILPASCRSRPQPCCSRARCSQTWERDPESSHRSSRQGRLHATDQGGCQRSCNDGQVQGEPERTYRCSLETHGCGGEIPRP